MKDFIDNVSGSDVLTTKYFSLEYIFARLWERNPKKHDIGSLIDSFNLHGFRDGPGFDETTGRFMHGNGRIESLKFMKDDKKPAPRGIAVVDGEWYVPCQIGVNSKSIVDAEAYAVDHNNLTMLGGDFDHFDIRKMWKGEQYTNLLVDIVANNGTMASVTQDVIDSYLSATTDNFPDEEQSGEGEKKLITCPACGHVF